MHIYILGIGGTFMSALALLAREAGYTVSGCDAQCYPPVSDLLKDKGIVWHEGYDDLQTMLRADMVIVGNAMKRGMPIIEALLDARKDYFSGPQWLAQFILPRYKVIAVAGTHGKTTTTSMIAYILHQAGLKPGFLIGGVATDLNTSAHLGDGEWFVIEADEYDSAFFDKRPKFLHYRPEIAVLNNLEFDHADIYADLEAIKQQFHYLLRTVAQKGLVIRPKLDDAIDDVLNRGQFTPIITVSSLAEADWSAQLLDAAGQSFNVFYQNQQVATVEWSLIGEFNVQNALVAIATAQKVGISADHAAAILNHFTPVKRRLEIKYHQNDITIYDDFAHHPTAIEKTLMALKCSERHQRLLVILEFASYTMKTGVHRHAIGNALAVADQVYILKPHAFDIEDVVKNWSFSYQCMDQVSQIVDHVVLDIKVGDAIVVMSNRGFGGIHQSLIEKIAALKIN